MRYMLLQSYGPAGTDCPPISEWAPTTSGRTSSSSTC